MPGTPRAGLERDFPAVYAGWIVRRKKLLNLYGASEVLGRAFAWL
jgi:hypothetical protein